MAHGGDMEGRECTQEEVMAALWPGAPVQVAIYLQQLFEKIEMLKKEVADLREGTRDAVAQTARIGCSD